MSRTRDRHDRGRRGPGVVPREPGRPELRTRAERFDDLALALLSALDRRWHRELGPIEYAVEDVPPLLPGGSEDWPAQVPLAGATRGTGGAPARLVLYRRPIELRCETRTDLEELLHVVIIEQLADLLGVAPEDVDPRYPDD